MQSIVLSKPTQRLEIKLVSAVTTNELDFTVHWADSITSALDESSTIGVTNGTSYITICDAPIASTQRIIKEITVYNADTVSATILIVYNDNGSRRVMVRKSLATLTHYSSDDDKKNPSLNQLPFNVNGPSSSVDGNIVQWDGVDGDTVKDGGISIDTDGTLSADSDNILPTQKAFKYYVDNKLYNYKGYVLTSDSVTSGTTETVLFNYQVLANEATTGSCFKIKCAGTSSSTGTLQFTIRVGTNGTTADTQIYQSQVTAAQAANEKAGIDVILNVRNATTAIADGTGYAYNNVLIPTVAAAVYTATIDTTQNWYIDIGVACSSGTYTANLGYIEQTA